MSGYREKFSKIQASSAGMNTVPIDLPILHYYSSGVIFVKLCYFIPIIIVEHG